MLITIGALGDLARGVFWLVNKKIHGTVRKLATQQKLKILIFNSP
jgi:hypothetical protein